MLGELLMPLVTSQMAEEEEVMDGLLPFLGKQSLYCFLSVLTKTVEKEIYLAWL